jgi:hypothetical protein
MKTYEEYFLKQLNEKDEEISELKEQLLKFENGSKELDEKDKALTLYKSDKAIYELKIKSSSDIADENKEHPRLFSKERLKKALTDDDELKAICGEYIENEYAHCNKILVIYKNVPVYIFEWGNNQYFLELTYDQRLKIQSYNDTDKGNYDLYFDESKREEFYEIGLKKARQNIEYCLKSYLKD